MNTVHEELGSVARGLWRDTDFESDLRDAVEPVLSRNAERYGDLSVEEFEQLLDRCVDAVNRAGLYPVMNSHTVADTHGIQEGDYVSMVHANDESRKTLFKVIDTDSGTEVLVEKIGVGPVNTSLKDLKGMGDSEEDGLYRTRRLSVGVVVESDRFEVYRNN